MRSSLLGLAALAQLAGCQYGYGFGRSQALVVAGCELADAHLAERVKVVVAVVEHSLHEVYRTFFG